MKKSPMTRMAVAALLRELLFKTQRYRDDKLAGKNPPFDMKLEAMLPVINGEIPLKCHAHRADDILTAVRIAKEFGVKATLDHCTDGELISDELAKEGISAEVIDPRTLVPFDYDTVAESVKKTGRLVVVHEAHQNNGWGAQVVSQVSQMVFPYLDAAPVHIGAKACPLPFNLGLEQAVLPSVKDIVDACKAAMYR